jgi:hypothetical protein
MRAWQLAAFAAATMTAHVAPAASEALVPVGLGSSADTGGVLGVTAQPGTRLSRNFRLRIDYITPTLLTGQQLLANAPRPRRLGTMMDFYPEAESGLRVSAGLRFLSKRGRPTWNPYKASQPGSLIYTPAAASKMPIRNNIAKTAPAMTIGWTGHVSENATFGLEAGTIMEHGGARHSAAAISQPSLKTAQWTRTDPVAQVAFALKF